MARGYNRVILMGNLARDPDVRFTPQQQKTARFTVACGREWKDKSTGEKKTQADFINCTAWSGTADICEKYLKKGNPVLVEGRISVRDFDDPKTGQHRWITEVVVDSVILMGSGRSERNDYQHTEQGLQSSDKTGFDDEFPLDFSEMSAVGAEIDLPF